MNEAGWIARALLIGVIFAANLVVGRPASGQTDSPRATSSPPLAPGTLFQWSYGNSFSGGPDPDAPIVTDRPDFTEASSTVGLGVRQLECGYTYTFNDGPLRSHSVGEPLLRMGMLANWFELRMGWNYLRQRVVLGDAGSSIAGFDDLYLGAKIGLTPQEAILPEMVLIPQMFVPVGSGAVSAGQLLPGMNWVYGWDVNDFLTTAGSTQVNRRVDGVTGRCYYQIAQSWTVGYSLTDRLGAYTEWFVFIPTGADTEATEHFFDGGFTYLVTDNLQLDIRGGKGVSAGADEFFVGSGASIRF